PLTGAGEQVMLASSVAKHVDDISHDGKYLLFEQAVEAGNAGRPQSADAQKTLGTGFVQEIGSNSPPKQLIPAPVSVHMARYSPDDQWIVYTMADSGKNQLFVTSTVRGGKKQLTTTGAWGPRWRSDGKAIYYLDDNKAVFELPITVTPQSLDAG